MNVKWALIQGLKNASQAEVIWLRLCIATGVPVWRKGAQGAHAWLQGPLFAGGAAGQSTLQACFRDASPLRRSQAPEPSHCVQEQSTIVSAYSIPLRYSVRLLLRDESKHCRQLHPQLAHRLGGIVELVQQRPQRATQARLRHSTAATVCKQSRAALALASEQVIHQLKRQQLLRVRVAGTKQTRTASGYAY